MNAPIGLPLTGNVVSMPWPWAAVLPRKAASKWAYVMPAVTDSYPMNRVENLIVDPEAKLEDGCIVVAMYAGRVPEAMSWYIPNPGRDCGGRFVVTGSQDEKCLVGGLATSRRMMNGERPFFRILGRVFGEPRRHPRFRTWDDPE
jgi:hypothetical protein